MRVVYVSMMEQQEPLIPQEDSDNLGNSMSESADGANLEEDVSYQWLQFFLDDDELLEKIGQDYTDCQLSRILGNRFWADFLDNLYSIIS